MNRFYRSLPKGRIDKAECLQTELDELVAMVRRSDDLEKLKALVATNFPEEK